MDTTAAYRLLRRGVPFTAWWKQRKSVSNRMAALALVALCVSACSAAAPVPPARSLVEAYTIPVPRDFVVTGANVSATSHILLWSAVGSEIIVLDTTGKRMHRIGVGRSRRIIGGDFVKDSSEIVLFDARECQILRLNVNDGVVHAESLSFPGRAFAARRFGAEWLVGSRNVDGEVRLYLVRSGASRSLVAVRVPRGFAEFHLSGSDSVAFIAEMEPPFTVAMLRMRGATFVGAAPSLPFAAASLGSIQPDGGRWIALPLINAGNTYLQTVADLRGDRRVVLLRDAGGSPTRNVSLEVPLAFVTSDARSGVLYAYRRTPGNALVAYRQADSPVVLKLRSKPDAQSEVYTIGGQTK